jgi:hypothetical protein
LSAASKQASKFHGAEPWEYTFYNIGQYFNRKNSFQQIFSMETGTEKISTDFSTTIFKYLFPQKFPRPLKKLHRFVDQVNKTVTLTTIRNAKNMYIAY